MEGKLERYWPLSLRLLLGIAFIYHGAPKLFSAAEHAGFAGSLGQLGVPAAGFMAWAVGLVEFFGGIALLLGIFTAEAAVLLGIDMVVAMFKVHLPHGFNFVQITGMGPDGPRFGLPGAEVNLLYLAALVALFIGGPGPLSLEEGIAKLRESRLRPPWLRHRVAHA